MTTKSGQSVAGIVVRLDDFDVALRDAGDWIQQHPRDVHESARIMIWFPWELRVASDRTTVLLPSSYSLARIDEVIRHGHW